MLVDHGWSTIWSTSRYVHRLFREQGIFELYGEQGRKSIYKPFSRRIVGFSKDESVKAEKAVISRNT